MVENNKIPKSIKEYMKGISSEEASKVRAEVTSLIKKEIIDDNIDCVFICVRKGSALFNEGIKEILSYSPETSLPERIFIRMYHEGLIVFNWTGDSNLLTQKRFENAAIFVDSINRGEEIVRLIEHIDEKGKTCEIKKIVSFISVKSTIKKLGNDDKFKSIKFVSSHRVLKRDFLDNHKRLYPFYHSILKPLCEDHLNCICETPSTIKARKFRKMLEKLFENGVISSKDIEISTNDLIVDDEFIFKDTIEFTDPERIHDLLKNSKKIREYCDVDRSQIRFTVKNSEISTEISIMALVNTIPDIEAIERDDFICKKYFKCQMDTCTEDSDKDLNFICIRCFDSNLSNKLLNLVIRKMKKIFNEDGKSLTIKNRTEI